MEGYRNIVEFHRKLRSYQPKVRLEFKRGHYTVKTATTWKELERTLRLRYEVFHKEYKNKWFPIGIDMERLDAEADHLIIVDRRVDRIVGTYRLISSQFGDSYYSQGEFSLEKVLELPGSKLELSRACIERQSRNGTVFHLLWRGIIEYLRIVDAKFLFGCASIRTTNPREIKSIFDHLESLGAIILDHQVHPIGHYRIDFCDLAGAKTVEGLETSIPPLLSFYLKSGAKVCGTPALDRDFNCIDFFTLLDLNRVTPSVKRKYVSNIESH